jgi:hypothetical protein
MLVGNYDVIYFDDVDSCFETYGVITNTFKDWDRPFSLNDGYVIYYNHKLDDILDIKDYKIRRIMNPYMNLFNSDDDSMMLEDNK